jgi:hypothetical protein
VVARLEAGAAAGFEILSHRAAAAESGEDLFSAVLICLRTLQMHPFHFYVSPGAAKPQRQRQMSAPKCCKVLQSVTNSYRQ